jgi:hypothetical protein
VFKPAGLALALTAGVAGAIASYLALAAPRAADKVTGDTSAARAIWTEVGWPFPIDQWGTGRAFACKAADCGAELKLYLRAKLGACNCATGVADDEDLDRMSDFDLLSGDVSPFGIRLPADTSTSRLPVAGSMRTMSCPPLTWADDSSRV